MKVTNIQCRLVNMKLTKFNYVRCHQTMVIQKIENIIDRLIQG